MMPQILAKITNVPLEIIKAILEKDQAFHVSQEMCLEQLWQNANDENEMQFLFRIDTSTKQKW